jgi:DNA-binding LacI/PurR family transcriptional regulator
VSRPLRRLPLVEQTAAHLREGFQRGRWGGLLPGVVPLAAELMVSKDVARAALKVLEGEGWIEAGGSGRRRKILANLLKVPSRRSLRIGIMLYDPLEDDDGHGIRLMFGIRQSIEALGHTCVFGDRCLAELKENLSRISRVVKAVDADAWIVLAASRAVLEWFIAQPFAVYAFGGRFHDLAVACSATRMAPALESAVNTLVDQGHRRIVLLAPTFLRKPTPIPSIARFLALLEEHGIPATDYHLPHFEDSAEGLEKSLDALFHITPPTALLVNQTSDCAAVFFFLARRGLQVPRDVSVVFLIEEPVFRRCQPPIDHFRAPMKEHITSITRWVKGVATGRPTKHQVILDAVYVPGGTVGPAKK